MPVVTASLERRFSSRTWLVLGVAGAAAQRRADLAANAYGFTREDSRSLYLTTGIRRVLTRAGAPVDVSVLVLASAGVADADERYASQGTETAADVTSWLAGAGAGVAIDREITGGVSLRIASPLLGITYARDRVAVAGEPSRTGTTFSASALLAPRLELRLAF